MSEHGNPLVSVIIATYRQEKSLYNAVSSACAQTYTNIEIVIVDDNADTEWNEKVAYTIRDFLDDKRVVYIKNNKNEGSAETRNIGIKAAKGEYITFLDDDDIYLPEKIENQLRYMEKNNADYSITDLMLYKENGKLEEIRKRSFITDTDKKSLLKYHLKYHLTGTDTMMFKKTYLQKINYFDKIDVGDEFYLMLKAVKMDGIFTYVPLCDVKAYVHVGESGLSSGKSKICGENNLYEFKKEYFKSLDTGTVRYIKMRHHAVLAFAYLRMRNWGKTAVEGAKAIFCAPLQCIKLIMERN